MRSLITFTETLKGKEKWFRPPLSELWETVKSVDQPGE